MLELEAHGNKGAEQRYRSLVEQAPYAIVIVDKDAGVFVEDVNPSAEKLYGLDRSEILGKLGPHDLSPEFQPDGRRSDVAAMEYIQEALDGKFPSFEWTHRTAQGVDVPCQLTLSRLPDNSRNLVRASIIDLTELKRSDATQRELERQLFHARKLETIGQMTGGVAHDFNNLLSIIMGNLELLANSINEDDNAHKLIQNALDASEKGAALTHSMLNYARRASLQPTNIRLSEVVRNMQNMLSRTLLANISIHMKFNQERWLIHADAARTENVLLNLFLNARDAMPNGGNLTIEINSIEFDAVHNISGIPHGRYLVLSLTDNGIGIPADDIDRVFDPFFTTKGATQNSGLGLSMVHGFMTQSGGDIRVTSESGSGTEVKLYFPGIDAEDQLPVQTVNPKSNTTKRARILLTEDQNDVLIIFKKVLEEHGHKVLCAENGVKAAELFECDGKIDLLVTDIIMPGPMQGFELATHLREINPQLPVIFMSGYMFENPVERAEKGHKDIQLMKPVKQKAFLQAVQDALAE